MDSPSGRYLLMRAMTSCDSCSTSIALSSMSSARKGTVCVREEAKRGEVNITQRKTHRRRSKYLGQEGKELFAEALVEGLHHLETGKADRSGAAPRGEQHLVVEGLPQFLLSLRTRCRDGQCQPKPRTTKEQKRNVADLGGDVRRRRR